VLDQPVLQPDQLLAQRLLGQVLLQQGLRHLVQVPSRPVKMSPKQLAEVTRTMDKE